MADTAQGATMDRNLQEIAPVGRKLEGIDSAMASLTAETKSMHLDIAGFQSWVMGLEHAQAWFQKTRRCQPSSPNYGMPSVTRTDPPTPPRGSGTRPISDGWSKGQTDGRFFQRDQRAQEGIPGSLTPYASAGSKVWSVRTGEDVDH
ncbi:hypothetical protein NDU88_004243 [Pleurodeles waltl]|uniref:Uncharacterized protein n=1 Tax=Pleurodeles waltl TaxID=8319 RepID=A0AAV7LHI1_PLEWA|nr:hypothetical protein NDU88_004243 [Pleurodeles waltl]